MKKSGSTNDFDTRRINANKKIFLKEDQISPNEVAFRTASIIVAFVPIFKLDRQVA